MHRLLWAGVLAALLGPLGVARPVRAEVITFAFTGRVTDVIDPEGLFNGTYAVGQAVTGSYTFTTTPDDVFDSGETRNYFWYKAAGQPVDFRLQVGGAELVYDRNPFSFGESFRIGVFNDSPGGFFSRPGDGYDIGAGAEYPTFFADPGNRFLGADMGLSLGDETGAALSSVDLPLTPPDLAALSRRVGGVTLFDYDIGDYVGITFFEVTSLTVVPEPTSLALLGTAAASACSYVGWRRRRPPA